MPKRPYKKVTQYHFEVAGVRLAIVTIDKDYVVVEEVGKNGQEDTHLRGVLVRTMTGKFVWEEGADMFAEYESQELVDGIKNYLNEHGIPGQKG